jgi:hypothetical protein
MLRTDVPLWHIPPLKALWGARWLPLPPRSLFFLVKVLIEDTEPTLPARNLHFPFTPFCQDEFWAGYILTQVAASVIIFLSPFAGDAADGRRFPRPSAPLKGAFSFR